jgi:two-component system cell cycle response regulator CpdR
MQHKILLAEDDNDMRRFLVKALENAGFQVSSYDNGLSAYQRLREEPFEMLLTDIVMPEMDGSSWRAAPPSWILTSRSCSSPVLPPWH